MAACDARDPFQPEVTRAERLLGLKGGARFDMDCHWIDDPPDPGPPGGVTITRWECHEDHTGPGGGGGTSPDPGGGGGGGGGSPGQGGCEEIIEVTCTPVPPEEDWAEVIDLEDWSCHSAWEQCDKQPATQAQKDQALAAADLIRSEKDPFCGQIKQNAREMISRMEVWTATIRIYDNRRHRMVTLLADTYWRPDGKPVLHIWNQELGSTAVIAHEAMHGLIWPGDYKPMTHDGVYGGRTMDQWTTFCTT
jgi:hypothetical protein